MANNESPSSSFNNESPTPSKEAAYVPAGVLPASLRVNKTDSKTQK